MKFFSIEPEFYIIIIIILLLIEYQINFSRLQRYLMRTEDLYDLLNENKEVVDAPDAKELSSVRGKLEFSNVSFGYTPEQIVLKNVSFSVPPGKTVAIVGPSGAGKSTIVRLLFRFYDVLDGSISVDDHNVKSLTQKSLRQAMGVVPQDTILFNDSIKYNIKYGRLDASDDDVIEAARAAEIHDKIMKFTKKYDTEVGERGLKLSGGEKQRVAIGFYVNSKLFRFIDKISSLCSSNHFEVTFNHVIG